jgi:hypothetical protein
MMDRRKILIPRQFLDDFKQASGSAPDSSKWMVRTGTKDPGGAAQWGTGEIQTYTNSGNNIRQTGSGDLWIIPTKNNNGAWMSGRLETITSTFKAPPGGKLRVEAKIKTPSVTSSNGLGYWPAFWALGAAFRGNYTNWPSIGELDILENVNGQDGANAVVHCDVYPGGTCNEPTGLGTATACSGSRCPGNYHVYELQIDRGVRPETVQFFVDRKLQYQLSATQLGDSVWNRTVNSGFFLILNVAVGGAFPDALAGRATPTAATVSGQPMAVDYVAVWST